MKYKRVPFEMKKKIVSETMETGKFNVVARKYGIAHSTLGGWLSDDELNPDKEYARTRRENRVKNLKGPRSKIRKPKDPIPEGIVMAAKTNPEDLARENRDLRKKVEYLEDKVAYLEKLYEIINKKPNEIVKKKRFKAINELVLEGRKNIRRLCSIACVSAKCYYAYVKGPTDKEIADESLIVIIKNLQEL
ncbi:MAG: hypothetical protein PUC01_05625 [Spirochaetales bacterium]|nr:hypothetical protein [Spirochaetales bacterium]